MDGDNVVVVAESPVDAVASFERSYCRAGHFMDGSSIDIRYALIC